MKRGLIFGEDKFSITKVNECFLLTFTFRTFILGSSGAQGQGHSFLCIQDMLTISDAADCASRLLGACLT